MWRRVVYIIFSLGVWFTYLVVPVRAAITYQSAGAFAYSASGGTTVAPAYPASIASGNQLILIIGMKPNTANGGSVTTPSGWTLVTSLTGAGGYGTTLGADTGNTNIFVYSKTATGSESGTLTVTIASNGVSWARMMRLSNANGLWDVAGTTGSDTTAGSASIAFSTNPGVTAGDYILGAMVIPTDITTPSQFSAEALSQTGVTFGTVTEVGEADTTTGNDLGGFIIRAPVSSGTGSANPVMTATAGGTTTNVRGPGVFVRLRESTATTTLGAGASEPSNTTLSPGAGITDLAVFTFATNGGTDSVTAATVTLATGTYAGISELRLTSSDGATTYFSAVADPAGDTVNFSGGTPIPVTTSATTFKIRVTPKSHSNMPAVPGTTYNVTGTITSWTGTNGQAGSDSGSATVTIDNTSPANVTSTSGSTGIEQVSLSWTNPADADFSQIVVLRRANSSVSDTPTEGTTYSVGNTVGSSTVACVTVSTGCTDSGIPGAIPYHYKIFALDSNGNYSSGAVPTGSPFTPTALVISVTITSDGTVDYGLVNPNTAKSTLDLSDTQTVQNDSNVAADLTIKTTGATGGTPWTLGSNPGTNIFVHEFSLNSGGNWTKFSAADSYQSFITNLGVTASQNFDLRLTVPTSTTDYQEKSVTVTILATQH